MKRIMYLNVLHSFWLPDFSGSSGGQVTVALAVIIQVAVIAVRTVVKS